MTLRIVSAVLGVALLVGMGCSGVERKKTGRLRIVATTGMIGDAVKNITGDSAEVFVLMGPGVDPHLYKPTPRDVDMLSNGDIIVYNGLHLEGKMGEILHKIGKYKKTIAIASGLQPSRLIVTNKEEVAKGASPVYDPHIWFDVALWKTGVEQAGRELAQADSSHTNYYLDNLNRYTRELDKLDRWTREKIHSIPGKRRVMITAHDAFHYFGRAYNIEVLGLQGISTVAEPGLKDITDLVRLLTSRGIRSVFIESSISERNIRAVIDGAREKGHEVQIGGTLFSDAMGDSGTPEGTYQGMVRHNVETIVEGLR